MPVWEMNLVCLVLTLSVYLHVSVNVCVCVYACACQQEPAAVGVGCLTSWSALGSCLLICEWGSDTCAHGSREAPWAGEVAALQQAHLYPVSEMCPQCLGAHRLCSWSSP